MEMENKEIEKEFNELMQHFGPAFKSTPGYRMGLNYIRGLVGPVTRKNGWQLAEYLGETTPYAIQQFIYRGRFSSDLLRNTLRTCTGEALGEEDGVLVVDETGFMKQGKKSCGTQRQYSGTYRKLSNRGIFNICRQKRPQPNRQALIHTGRLGQCSGSP